ncbi:MAG: hypothetical protein KVP17_002894 [Porospora cf. gigantea B]|uniref:uncharacterized protein n=1 Tax=Porospora cf. gigantea B TaxID=2853592 RepID=UPI003571A7EB|nr:MAG: hypothetical protein KVP17_002894 [Porospora cf. gigantea B]
MPHLNVSFVSLDVPTFPDQAQEVGTGAHLWDGSGLLAAYFEKHPGKIRGKTVVEFGSGLGVGGMALGVLGARRVVLSDTAEVVPLTKKVLGLNAARIKDANSSLESIDVVQWVWAEEDVDGLLATLGLSREQVEVVVAADVIFNVKFLEALVTDIQEVATPTTTVYVAYERRDDFLEKEFLRHMKQIFAVVKVVAARKITRVPTPFENPELLNLFIMSRKRP